MRIDILTLFPEMFASPFGCGIFKRATEQGLVSMHVRNIRDYTHDRHHTVDDTPFGGGAGMVLKPEPIFESVEAVKAEWEVPDAGQMPVILLSPQGRLFSQLVAQELSRHSHMILICGRYEGVDERVAQYVATDEISIGDYVLSGGELAAMVIVDTVVRLLPGVVGSTESVLEESHTTGLLEYPQYTRPAMYRGWEVPPVLLSGNHAEIARWRRKQALLRTLQRRPELLSKAALCVEERQLVEGLK
jgi:tRNA (guanine37-N1)-methyltransferase